MEKKVYILLIIAMSCIFVFAQWTDVKSIWVYSNSYFPPTSSKCLVSDSTGYTYMTWHDHTFDFYFDVMTYRYSGSSWSSWTRVDDPLNGQGVYGLSWMPTLSVEPDGKRMIVWEDYRSGNFELYAKYYNNVDIPSQVQLTFDSVYTWYPKLQYKNGKHHLMYMSQQQGSFDIYSNLFDSSWHEEQDVMVVDNNVREFSYNMFNDSTGILVFTMDNGGYDNLYYANMNNSIWDNYSSIMTGDFDIYYPNIISDGNHSYLLSCGLINGIYQIFLSKFDGSAWSYPEMITDNNSNAQYPTGIINGNDMYIFYVSDGFPNGVIECAEYDIALDSIINKSIVVEEREGPIVTPQVSIDANGDLQLVFSCGDDYYYGSRGPNSLYQITLENVKSKTESGDVPYVLKHIDRDIIVESKDTNSMNINLIDKTGRVVESYDNVFSCNISTQNKMRNDVYFLRINIDNRIFTEKVIWLR